jgi:hypothetical protein
MLPGMARSWTRLHEYLGTAPGPLTFDMIKQATDANLDESDDLDWKEQLPQPPRDGRWNELAKDVAAMANTRGGLLIYGVQDKTTQLVGIDPGEVNAQQYAQWVRNHVQPYLPDLTFTTLTSPDGATSVLVIDVPASPMAPHHVYGTAAKDKDQQAAVVPYRDADHTAWMAEHQIERAYRDRFTRVQHAQEEVERLLDHARETVFEERDPSAWFIAIVRPERPLPRTAPRLERESAGDVYKSARTRSQRLTGNPMAVGPLAALEYVAHNPRPGLRRWVLSTLALNLGRQIHTELHDDGSAVLVANLAWKAARGDVDGDPAAIGILVDEDVTGACCRDAVAVAHELARHLRVDSAVHLTATIATLHPTPLVPIVTEYGGFRRVPDHARRPRRIQPVAATVTPAADEDLLRTSAQEVFTDLMNQFGLTPRL